MRKLAWPHGPTGLWVEDGDVIPAQRRTAELDAVARRGNAWRPRGRRDVLRLGATGCPTMTGAAELRVRGSETPAGGVEG